MNREPASTAFLDLYRAYAAELPRWFWRLHLPERDRADAAQEVWLELNNHPGLVLSSPREARRLLFQVAVRVADRLRRRAARAASRRSPRTPDDLAASHDVEERAAEALALMEALDAFEPATRRLLIASKVLGLTEREIAEGEGLSLSAVKARIWRASAELARRMRAGDEQHERRGVLLLPAAIVIAPEACAAMCAIWEAEGRLPSFGGPGGPGGRPPAPPPPQQPPTLPTAPALPWLVASPAAAVVLVVVLVFGPAVTVLVVLSLGAHEHPALARAGLEAPPPVLAPASSPPPAPSSPSSAASPPSSAPRPGGKTLSAEDRRKLRFARGISSRKVDDE